MVEAVRNIANIPSPFAAFDEPMPPVTLGGASSGRDLSPTRVEVQRELILGVSV